MKVNVIIPTFKPDSVFEELMEKLLTQTLQPEKIIIMNTEEKYWGERKLFPNTEVHHLSMGEFGHGATRTEGVLKGDGDIFLCMTQDAMPADRFLIENLVKALTADETIAAAYARQMAGENSSEIEKFTRVFNYPEESSIKGKEQLNTLGIKTYFCSNVCAAYKRDLFLELGGFVKHTIFNEDMLFAAKAVQAGKRIAYAADARVYHSHDYTRRQQFHRNFDNGVSQADHPEIFEGISSESEGMRLVKQTVAHLWKKGKPGLILKFCVDCAAKYAGFFLGKHYRRLPKKMVTACSMNRHYWE